MPPVVWILVIFSVLLGALEWWLGRRQIIGHWMARTLIGCDVLAVIVLIGFYIVFSG